MSILQQLLLGEAATEFMERHYGKLPFAHRGGAGELLRQNLWDTVDRVLGDPKADVILGREGTQWPGERPLDLAAAREIMRAGYTLGIRHAHRNDAGLQQLAEQFAVAFEARVDVHLYCTPAQQPGFGWHYDAEDVFVLQLEGEKEWWLRKNTVHPWPLMDYLPHDQHAEREIMPSVSCKLNAGDWLYIPVGYWHRTQAGGESVSLSVGLSRPTAIDLYDFLRPQLAQSLLWRQRLPCSGSVVTLPDAELKQQLHEAFAVLADDLRQNLLRDGVAEAFRDWWRSNLQSGPRQSSKPQ